MSDLSNLPDVGTYWSTGRLPTSRSGFEECYDTCARCGSFVNSPDRHEDWHRAIEPTP